jgi:DMSO/TMAO reductase YedYZ molybdopterin-dependent catalytic subunit
MTVQRTGERPVRIAVADLLRLPSMTLSNCFIVSTGHGTSGPFTFGGVRLLELLESLWGTQAEWHRVDVISADGFGTRISRAEVAAPTDRPILLAYALDGVPLTRAQGLVRLIVPSETDDALRQVKWVAELRVE